MLENSIERASFDGPDSVGVSGNFEEPRLVTIILLIFVSLFLAYSLSGKEFNSESKLLLPPAEDIRWPIA